MSTILRRTLPVSTLITAAALLLVGCASSTDEAIPDDSGNATTPDTSAENLEFEAAWLDNGRLVAIVTQGSSTCVPVASEVTASGQTVDVTLEYADPAQACTADLTARASLVGLPAGVDPTQDVELRVTLDGATSTSELDGNAQLTGIAGESTDYAPSAGWFDDHSLVLLTWGSSSCQPVVESVQAEGQTGTVTFVTEDRACTMDMAPRTTIIAFDGIDDDAEGDFVLTLVGDNLDGTLNVIER